MIARHLIVRGRVQGVGYRYWTEDRARAAGLTGWVRNRPDGTVEIVAEGEETAIAAFIDACRDGPSGARVEAVEATDLPPVGTTGFERRTTG
ncbi:acylphosphatase [Sphingomonas solaris]|uniref:acylphosphatase n=1 Tax=Alterirhizorhabdus solaris TaxID=2529389 RepID=A0A558RD23_9SPHN|nr:acylphosphatase [Sphingomonas solaris]TVV77233.1 acylphosphatase [Sphingomonas solaris]